LRKQGFLIFHSSSNAQKPSYLSDKVLTSGGISRPVPGYGWFGTSPGWLLSTDRIAYDLNPVPEMDQVRVNQTAISEDQNEPSIFGAVEWRPAWGSSLQPRKPSCARFSPLSPHGEPPGASSVSKPPPLRLTPAH